MLAAHELVGLDRSVISNTGHFLRFCKTVAETVARARGLATAISPNAGTSIPTSWSPWRPAFPAAARSACASSSAPCRRTIAARVIIGSSHQGQYPDADAAKPFFELVTDLDIPVFVHPADATTPATADYRLASSISRPADNCLSLARLIVRGIFEQFPTLKLVGSHLGGGICEVIGRMDYAYNLPDFAFFLGPTSRC